MAKTCPKCVRSKPDEEFIRVGTSRTPTRHCATCRDRANRYMARFSAKRKEPTKHDLFREEIKAHNRCCEICGIYCGPKIQIDHDHETGYVRGLLCGTCNIGLGQFKDNPELLAKAIEYLAKEPKDIRYGSHSTFGYLLRVP